MKTNIFILALSSLLLSSCTSAQSVTTVNARNADISDNLDLRAVASIFGDASNLEDFERRLNNPNLRISNLDLNNDGKVDYLRVVESVESRTHVIVIQAVLDADVFQDFATVEVERNNNGQVQVQVVGNVYMYGPNYIYEPIYVTRPVIYTTFWVNSYRPYYSPWRWNYYPTYYQAWNPYPVYAYRRSINQQININHNYNYVNVRRSQRAATIYDSRRSNGYERLNPGRSFAERNNVNNRYELERTRTTASNGRRNSYQRNESSTRIINPNENADSRVNTYRRTESGTRVTTRNENTTGSERNTYRTSEYPTGTGTSTRRNESFMQNNSTRMATPSTTVVNPENVRSGSEQRNNGIIERSESRNTSSPTRVVQSAPQQEYNRGTSNDFRGSSRGENSGSTRGNYRN